MEDIVKVKLFSADSIEISDINGLKDRNLMKLKLYVQQIQDINVVIGKNEIIIKCDDSMMIGDVSEKILRFLSEISIEYEADDKLKQIVEKTKQRKAQNKVNIEVLTKIKNEEFDNSYEEFQSECDKLLKIKLIDYQYKSAYLLVKAKSGFDFSVPGSGKTIITYATYAYNKNKQLIDNILIIGPKNAYNAWYEEYNTCFGKNPEFENLSEMSVSHAKDYLKSTVSNHKEITFINIEKVRFLEKELPKFLSVSNCLLVIDEGHKVKNPNAASTKVAMHISKYTNHKIILTGTPMPNGYEDLYSLTYIINPYEMILPFNYSQLRKFTVRGIKESDESTLMSSIYPYYSRVSKKYLINRGELLPQRFNVNYSEMSENQRYVYNFMDGLIANYHNKWELEFERILMKAILIRKMQISSNPKLLRKSLISSFDELRQDLVYSEDSDEITNEMIEDLKRKLAIADEIINKDLNNSHVAAIIKKFINEEELVNKNILAVELAKKIVDSNKKVILWDTFVENMDTLKNMLISIYNINAEVINGTVTGLERQNTINRFRNGTLQVLIASPATLAESISLHKCCQNAIYVNRNFNAAQFIQSKDRIHRINMPEGTTADYIFLLNRDSVDEGISERLELKEKRMLRILDAESIQIGSIENQDNSIMSDEDVMATYAL